MRSNTVFTVVIGAILIIVGAIITFSQDWSKTEEEIARDEAAEKVVSVDANDEIKEENIGKVIAVSGKLNREELLIIDDYSKFGVNTAYLQRNLEVYQWLKKCDGDNCEYVKEWSSKIISSEDYDNEHQNPTTWEHQSEEFFDDDAAVGVYKLSHEVAKKMPLMGTERKNYVGELADGWKQGYNQYHYFGEIQDNKIGDIRVKYQFNKEDAEISILAMLDDKGTLVPYEASNGKEVLVVQEGVFDAETLLNAYYRRSRLVIAVYTIFGICLMIAGVSMIIKSFVKKRLAAK